jgi:hypothetical protein
MGEPKCFTASTHTHIRLHDVTCILTLGELGAGCVAFDCIHIRSVTRTSFHERENPSPSPPSRDLLPPNLFSRLSGLSFVKPPISSCLSRPTTLTLGKKLSLTFSDRSLTFQSINSYKPKGPTRGGNQRWSVRCCWYGTMVQGCATYLLRGVSG